MGVRELLRQDAEKDLLRFTLVGSVDDGKSTLIGRLLHDARGVYEDQLASVRKASMHSGVSGEIDFSLITDGLKAEREQKITIDVAYRYFSTPRRKFIIADTPGHEQYTRNMATGASTANLAITLIDARLGVLPQSKRHAFITSLLGISHMIVAVNKMDLVGYSEEVFERIRADYTAFSARLRIPDTTFIPISAIEGDNVVEMSPSMPWYQGSPLLHHLETAHIASDANLIDLRFPIQYVVRPNLDFRGYCGSVASGVLRKGDEVLCLPSGRRTRVRAIVTYDGELEQAVPPQAVTVVLEDNVDLSRGGMLVHPHNVPHTGERIEAMLVWMDEHAAKPGVHYLVKQTTNTVPAVLTDLLYSVDVNTLRRQQTDGFDLNAIGRASLELRRPLLWDPYTQNRATGSIILVDRLSNRTVAAGMIVNREPAHASSYHATAQPTARSAHVVPSNGKVSRADREAIVRQKGAVVWLTGLSGSGKSTVAYELEKRLASAGRLAYVLDGDNLRAGLCSDLGFSADDRTENVRRAGEVAALLADAGLIVLVALISPYRADRERVRNRVPKGTFLEVFLDAPLEVCESRDPKGLYRKARAGEIREFTGIDAPYEPPEAPDLVLATHELSLENAVEKVEALLLGAEIIGAPNLWETTRDLSFTRPAASS